MTQGRTGWWKHRKGSSAPLNRCISHTGANDSYSRGGAGFTLPPWRVAVAILPGTAERDAPQVNSSHDQRDAAITVEVAMETPPLMPCLCCDQRRLDTSKLPLCHCCTGGRGAADGGHGDRTGCGAAGVTVSQDHAGGQVQDGGGEVDGLGAIIYPPPSWHRRKQQSCCHHRNRLPRQQCPWVGPYRMSHPGKSLPSHL